MAVPATNPDAVAQALIDVLSPNGVPVGGIGAFTKRTPDAPYKGPFPIIEVKPVQNTNTPVAASNSHQDSGWIELVYRDVPLTQAQANVEAPGATQADLEDRFWTARNAIVATLRAVANRKLGGAVAAVREIAEQYNPDGPYATWQGAEWVVWACRVAYIGPRQNQSS